MIRWMMFFLVGMLMLPATVIAQDTPIATSGLTIHVVQRNETLFSIAQQYESSVDELAALNGLGDVNNIQAGQRLLVPTDSSPVEQIAPRTHTVLIGETLDSIATFYGVTVSDLINWNPEITSPETIYVGQVLTVSGISTTGTFVDTTDITTAEEDVVHTIQSGETLFRIATMYGVTVDEIVQANAIEDPTLIFAGQTLTIPGVAVPQPASTLPAPLATLDISPPIFIEGKTGRLQLTTVTSVTVSGRFLEQELRVASEQEGTVHTILVGVPVFTEPGIYQMTLNFTDGNAQVTTLPVNLLVIGGAYGSEIISLLEDRNELLNPIVEDEEMNLLRRVMSPFTPDRYFDGQMGLPAAAPITSPFGTNRSYDGGQIFDRFHGGTDFAGAPGSPIIAPAAGRVVLADTLNVRGIATVIDHGHGVYSLYAHQSERFVELGEFVTPSQVIGSIGSTGRVEGAHLHWEIWVNGIQVDPMQWVSHSFS